MRISYWSFILCGCLVATACEKIGTIKLTVSKTTYKPYAYPIPSEIFIRVNKLLDERYRDINVVVYPSEFGYDILIAAAGSITEDARKAATLDAVRQITAAIAEDLKSHPEFKTSDKK
jgi:hypothetical protein